MFYVETVVPAEAAESRLRREPIVDELVLQSDGSLPLPHRPGLGIELNRDALAEFAGAASKLALW